MSNETKDETKDETTDETTDETVTMTFDPVQGFDGAITTKVFPHQVKTFESWGWVISGE